MSCRDSKTVVPGMPVEFCPQPYCLNCGDCERHCRCDIRDFTEPDYEYEKDLAMFTREIAEMRRRQRAEFRGRLSASMGDVG